MSITVTSSVVLDRDTVEVIGAGPRGGEIDFIVRMNRRDKTARSAYQHQPHKGFLPRHQVPLEIVAAAEEAYRVERQ